MVRIWSFWNIVADASVEQSPSKAVIALMMLMAGMVEGAIPGRECDIISIR